MTRLNVAEKLAALPDGLYPWRSEHQEEIERYFGDRLLRSLTAAEQARLGRLRLFCLLFSNRSGSTLLADTLYRAGFPIPPQVELFNADLVIDTAGDAGIDSFVDYLMAIADGWCDRGCLGFKIGPRQFAWFARLGLLAPFREVRVLTCDRQDKLRQAISLHLARQTDSWHSAMPPTRDRSAVGYRREVLLACLQEVLETERLIDYLCTLHGLSRLAVSYEDVVAHASTVVADVGEFLGIEVQPREAVDPAMVPPLEPQSGPVNEELLATLLEEFSLHAS